MKAVQVIVKGKVQKVFFRASTKAVADVMGIKGIAKNLPDGTVLIEAEGKEIFLKDFIDWCKEGPDDAKVESIEVTEIATKNYLNFEVLKK